MIRADVTESREYAGRTLKADDAAQPKGCSVCFVPVVAIAKQPTFYVEEFYQKERGKD